MANKRNQPPLVSTEAKNRIRSFANDLVALCRQYGMDIYGCGGITIIDDRRVALLRDGYEFDASFQGCDSRGIYESGAGEKQYVPVQIEDLQPEDWYVEEVKR